jgi:multidrug efflux pump subunit AcrB
MVIKQETIMNMLLSFAAVALISVPVLGSTKAVLIVLLCVMAIDIDLLGLLWLNGYDLNSITMISLVMAIGLVVDYLAHIVHYFMGAADRDPKQVIISGGQGWGVNTSNKDALTALTLRVLTFFYPDFLFPAVLSSTPNSA